MRKNQPAFLQISQRKKLVFSQVKIIRRALSFVSQGHAGLKCESGKWSRDTQLECGGEVGEQRTMPYHGTSDSATWGISTTWTIISASDAVLV